MFYTIANCIHTHILQLVHLTTTYYNLSTTTYTSYNNKLIHLNSTFGIGDTLMKCFLVAWKRSGTCIYLYLLHTWPGRGLHHTPHCCRGPPTLKCPAHKWPCPWWSGTEPRKPPYQNHQQCLKPTFLKPTIGLLPAGAGPPPDPLPSVL